MRQTSRQLVPVLVAALGTAIAIGSLAVSRWLSQSESKDERHPTIQRLHAYDPFQRLELVAYDWRARRAAERNTEFAPRLGLVLLDDDTIQNLQRGDLLGQPMGPMWPRYIYGMVLRELMRQGAEAVAFDILLGDERLDHGNVPLEGYTNLTSDAFFAEQLRRSGSAILGSTTNFPPTALFRRSAWALGDVGSPRDIDGSARQVTAFVDYRFFHPAIEAQARRQGLRIIGVVSNAVVLRSDSTDALVQWPIATNGAVTIRLAKASMQVNSAFAHRRVWHLGIVLAAHRLGLDLDRAEIHPEFIRLISTNGHGDRELPVGPDHRFPVNWSMTSTNTTRTIAQSMITLISDDRNRELYPEQKQSSHWTNALVVVGSTATGNNFADRGATPLASVDYLTSTYLNVADSVLRGQFVKPAPAWLSFLLVGALSILAALVVWLLRPIPASLMVLALAVVYLFSADFAFQHGRWWLPVVHPLTVGLLLNYATMVTYRGVFEQTEQQRIRGIFAKIVSPNVVQELLQADTVQLSGARRRLTVFFADVRGFTELTDRAQAEAEEHVRQARLTGPAAEAYFEQQSAETLKTVNVYLAAIADIVKQHGGTLDKYIGDCVMAFWGAPTVNPRHAADAVTAAIQAQRAILRLNQERETENRRREKGNAHRAASGLPTEPMLPLLSLGSGINTGFMTVGLMGSDSHILNFTVFGREVNLASRLEGVSGRGRIIIGEQTYLDLRNDEPDLAARCTRLDPVSVKGFRHAVPVYEVPWQEPALANVTAENPHSPS